MWVAESVEQTWRRLVDVDAYERWWPWLTLKGDRRLFPGSSIEASVRSPLGYRVNFSATPTSVVDGSSIDAAISGDIVGSGWLRVSSEPSSGVWIDVGWDVRVVRASFRMVAPLARSVLEWGHNRVVDRAITQFGGVVVDDSPRARGRRWVPAAAVIVVLIAALGTSQLARRRMAEALGWGDQGGPRCPTNPRRSRVARRLARR